MEIDVEKPDQYQTGVVFPKLELRADEKARVNVLSLKKWEIALTHWVDRMGYVHCLYPFKTVKELIEVESDYGKPEDCILCKKSADGNKHVGLPSRRYAVRVLRYKTDVQGNPVATGGLQYWMEIWILGPKKFSQVIEKWKEWGNLAKHDLALHCTEAKYQNMDIDIKKDALWIAEKDKVVAYWKSEADKYNLMECLGAKVPKEILERRFAMMSRREPDYGPTKETEELDAEKLLGEGTPTAKPASAAKDELAGLFDDEKQPKPDAGALLPENGKRKKGSDATPPKKDYLEGLLDDL